jgi:hypothetical protein
VIITVVAVRVVQPAVDQEIDVVAVRHPLMAAVVVLAGAGDRGALRGVGRVDRQNVLVVMAVVRAVQVAVVEIVHMAVVADAGVAAVVAVYVPVLFVNVVAHTYFLLSGNR